MHQSFANNINADVGPLLNIPFPINHEDTGAIVLTDKINCALKSAARSITRIRLTDKVKSDTVLQKAGLRSLNEMVIYTSATTIWKSKLWMDPLGSLLFPKSTENPNRVSTRSKNSSSAKPPVPGCKTLAANLLARLWNESQEIKNAETLGAAKKAARKLSKSLLKS